MTFTHALSTNNYGPAKFIVDGSAANGTHTTIATALTSASSGDTIFIRPGTYTENLTLKAGVNLTAFGSDSSSNGTGHIIISGKATFTAAGTVTIEGIQLQTNSDFFLAVTGTAASNVNLINCYLNCTNNTGISYTTSDATSILSIRMCSGDVGTTGITIFAHSSAGRLRIDGFYCTNTGNSVTASTASAGTLEVLNVKIQTPITTSGTNSIFNFQNSAVSTNINNATCLTIGGSGGNAVTLSNFNSGTASAISIGSAATISNTTVSSGNTNAVTGAGTLVNGGIAMGSTSSLINTTTQTARNFDVGGISFDGGTNILNVFTQGTFTPTSEGSSTSSGQTYTIQVGRYQRVGRMVSYMAYAATSANTSTGGTRVGGLPFTAISTANSYYPTSVFLADSQTTTNTQAFAQARVVINTNQVALIGYANGTGVNTSRTPTATCDIELSGNYEV